MALKINDKLGAEGDRDGANHALLPTSHTTAASLRPQGQQIFGTATAFTWGRANNRQGFDSMHTRPRHQTESDEALATHDGTPAAKRMGKRTRNKNRRDPDGRTYGAVVVERRRRTSVHTEDDDVGRRY